MVNKQIVSSSKCTGVSYYTADCFDDNCSINETQPRSKATLETDWSECSSTCGIGLSTRQVGCSANSDASVDCQEPLFEQKTCESYKKCTNQSKNHGF